MHEQNALTLEELKAEQSKLESLIKIARKARIVALRKELDELLSEHDETDEVPVRKSPALDKTLTKRLYTMKEAAHSLGMSTISVRRLVDRGLLKPNLALRRLLFPAAELDRFANES
jgi:hypothetical protein